MNTNTGIGDLIRSKRKTKRWTQSQLAERLNTTQVAVSDWETGKSIPRVMPWVRQVLGINDEEYQLALAHWMSDDPVIRGLFSTTKISAEAKQALRTLYQEAVLAHAGRQRPGET